MRKDPFRNCGTIFFCSVMDIVLTLWPCIFLTSKLDLIEVYMAYFAGAILVLMSDPVMRTGALSKEEQLFEVKEDAESGK